jgi:hypothetical protein
MIRNGEAVGVKPRASIDSQKIQTGVSETDPLLVPFCCKFNKL